MFLPFFGWMKFFFCHSRLRKFGKEMDKATRYRIQTGNSRLVYLYSTNIRRRQLSIRKEKKTLFGYFQSWYVGLSYFEKLVRVSFHCKLACLVRVKTRRRKHVSAHKLAVSKIISNLLVFTILTNNTSTGKRGFTERFHWLLKEISHWDKFLQQASVDAGE